MKKSTKHLLSFLIASAFVGASAGAVAVTINNVNSNDAVVASAETEKTSVDLAAGLVSVGKWGKGDFGDTMAHIRLNAPGDVVFGEENQAVNNAKLPATVLDNVWVNGKSISQHNAEYKALIESGAQSPITWDESKSFSGEIADDVKNNRAVYAPIFIKLVNHGAGLPGNTIDMYIPNSYLTAADITEVKITKDFLFETETSKFTFSDDVFFKSNSLCKPDKYIGEANLPSYNFTNVVETEVTKVDGRDGKDVGDKFLSFYLGESDYTGSNTAPLADFTLLKTINFFDYILIDGVKMGSCWTSGEPGERFFNVWGRSNSFSTRWPTGCAPANVQEIKVLAGCQFPSYADQTNTIYEVKEDITLVRMPDDTFVNTKYLLDDSKVAVSEAKVAGEAAELLAFDITFDGWNSTCNKEDYNYFGAHYLAMRKNILINGVSLHDINMNTDDSQYVYSTSPWTSGETSTSADEYNGYQIHQNPTHITGEGNKLTVYVHKQYVEDNNLNEIKVTIKEGFTHHATPDYVVSEDITAKVWAKPVDVTVITGNPRTNPESVSTISTKYGETVTLETPTAEGKVFAGWIDVDGNEVAASFVATEATAVYATWDITPYTVTIKQDGEEDQTFTFGVEAAGDVMLTPADLAAVLEDNLPEDTADWDYEWAEAIPETFELKDYTFTVTATEITTVDFFIMGETTTIEIPAGKTAQTYPRMAGDYTFNWTGDAKVKVDGVEVAQGAVVTLWGSFIEVIPNDNSAACTVVLTLAEYKAPATPVVLGENAITVTVENYYCAGVEVEFTAPAAGKYVIKAADGEENADLGIILGEYEIEWATLPYEIELEEGEALRILVCTTAYMTLTEDEINFVIEEAPNVITTIAGALAAEDGAAVVVSGTVCEVNTAWSEQFGNITVTIVDEDGNKLYVFRLATNVVLGDIITVTGNMGSYNGNKQVAAGATAEKTGHDSSYDYVEKTVAEALAAEDGTNVIVTGTVVEINTAYSEQHGNISVTIEGEDGSKLYLYRLSGNVELWNVIEVKGTMATYKEARQLTGGTYTLISEGEAPVEPPVEDEDSSSSVEDSTSAEESASVEDSTSAEESVDAPADTTSEEEKKDGCGSVIGGVALGAVALAGAAMLIRKKKED